MGRRNAVILAVAVALGLLAVYIANSWFTGREKQQEIIAEQQQLSRVAVARQDLVFGTPLTSDNVRLMNWPMNSVPAGAFTDVSDLLNGTRVALRPIAIGEPILASRVSGADGRATIAANLPKEMRAVSIPVNAVSSVSGFVTPGDAVDILLTRQIPGDGAGNDDKMTSVLMENVQVIGINQTADESKTEPVVGDTATVIVDQYGAQKLALAQQLGSLSLALRNVENQNVGATEVVTAANLAGSGLYVRSRPSAPAAAPAANPVRTPSRPAAAPAQAAPRRYYGPTMTVVRGTESTVNEVNSYGL